MFVLRDKCRGLPCKLPVNSVLIGWVTRYIGLCDYRSHITHLCRRAFTARLSTRTATYFLSVILLTSRLKGAAVARSRHTFLENEVAGHVKATPVSELTATIRKL